MKFASRQQLEGWLAYLKKSETCDQCDKPSVYVCMDCLGLYCMKHRHCDCKEEKN